MRRRAGPAVLARLLCAPFFLKVLAQGLRAKGHLWANNGFSTITIKVGTTRVLISEGALDILQSPCNASKW